MEVSNIHDMYDHHASLIMRIVLNKDACCVDVGAHQGVILREMRKFAPLGTHYAFEPIPYLFNRLREAQEFKDVKVYDLALSDEAGTATFFHVKNAPGYSGLRRRRYDRPDPVIEQLTVTKARLDDVIPAGARIDLIKIDVEGGELPVLRGAERILRASQPYIVFESGMGASEHYGTSGTSLYEFIAETCGLEINTLDGFLTGRPALTKERLGVIFDKTERYYFVAHRRLSDRERLDVLGDYALEADHRLFEIEAQMYRIETLERQMRALSGATPDLKIVNWGEKQTIKGKGINVQKSGVSAIWINVENAPIASELRVKFGSEKAPAPAIIIDKLITSAVPQAVIDTVGEYEVVIEDDRGKSTRVGTFSVTSPPQDATSLKLVGRLSKR